MNEVDRQLWAFSQHALFDYREYLRDVVRHALGPSTPLRLKLRRVYVRHRLARALRRCRRHVQALSFTNTSAAEDRRSRGRSNPSLEEQADDASTELPRSGSRANHEVIQKLERGLWLLGLSKGDYLNCVAELDSPQCQLSQLSVSEMVFCVDQAARFGVTDEQLHHTALLLCSKFEKQRSRMDSLDFRETLDLLRLSCVELDTDAWVIVGRIVEEDVRVDAPFSTNLEWFELVDWVAQNCPARTQLQAYHEILKHFAVWNDANGKLDELMERLSGGRISMHLPGPHEPTDRQTTCRTILGLTETLSDCNRHIQDAERPAYWDEHSWQLVAKGTAFAQLIARAFQTGHPQDVRMAVVRWRWGGIRQFQAIAACLHHHEALQRDDRLLRQIADSLISLISEWGATPLRINAPLLEMCLQSNLQLGEPFVASLECHALQE